MLIIFSVNDQKITHDLKGQLVAGSVDIVQAVLVPSPSRCSLPMRRSTSRRMC